MTWYEIVISMLTGLVAVIPLVVKLVEYVQKAVKEKNWQDLLKLVTNLMEEDYTTEITTGENPASPVLTTGRFSLTIGGVRPDIGERDENSARWTISINHCHVSVSGLSTDSDVLFYTTDGILRHSATPFLGKCEAELSPGVYVVRAEGNSKVIGLVRRDK